MGESFFFNCESRLRLIKGAMGRKGCFRECRERKTVLQRSSTRECIDINGF
jgi:hypothetical protein